MLQLPAELTITILSHLPLPSLSHLHQLSKAWSHFLQVNEEQIYRHAAAIHGWIPSARYAFAELGSLYSRKALMGVDGWKDFCHNRVQINQSWKGQGPSHASLLQSIPTSHPVHRIKVDEKAGYVITTSSKGGIDVVDLGTDEVLWGLPKKHVPRWAHCEYDNGFLIFDRRPGNAKEVWISLDHDTPNPSPNPLDHCPSSPPDAAQLRAQAQADDAFVRGGHDLSTRRGRFRPWALLTAPEPTRAFRFVYPTLVVLSDTTAYLWDVRTGEISETIPDLQKNRDAGRTLGSINYVEVSERYVFVCGVNLLRVFSRVDGSCVLDIPSTQNSYADVRMELCPTTTDVSRKARGVGAALVPHELKRRDPSRETVGEIWDQFIAVHISPCSTHLLALLKGSILLVIYDFERIIRGEVTLRETAVQIQLGPAYWCSRYLAVGGAGAGGGVGVAVATGSGIFIVQLPPSTSTSTSTPHDNPPRATVTVSRLTCCYDEDSLRGISCLQMSDTGVYVNWDRFGSLDSDSDNDTDGRINELLVNPPESYFRLPNRTTVILADDIQMGPPVEGNCTVLYVDVFPEDGGEASLGSG